MLHVTIILLGAQKRQNKYSKGEEAMARDLGFLFALTSDESPDAVQKKKNNYEPIDYRKAYPRISWAHTARIDNMAS